MSREVYTYPDLKTIAYTDNFRKLCRYPIITVSKDFKKSLYGRNSENTDIKVTDFHSFSRTITKGWNTDQSKFTEMTLISEYLNNKINEYEVGSADHNRFTGYIRNIDSILSSFLLLEQVGLSPDDLVKDNDPSLEIFCEIWSDLLERDRYVHAYHSCLANLNGKNAWNSIFKEVFDIDSAALINKIVFVGFYYITPYQERIMRLLEKSGFELVFLINYDSRYPYVYEVWEDAYSEKMGFVPKSSWHEEKSTKADPYGMLFEGEVCTADNKLTIREYSSVMEFVNDVKKIRKKGCSIYSPDHKSVNNMLKMYYPDDYGDRKILAYPVGQFINVINSLWDDEKNMLAISEDQLIECFSSGWLSLNGVDAKQHIKELFYILPFFKGCDSFEKWERRIDKLKEIYSEAVGCFDSNSLSDRWQQTVDNPLKNFSIFAVEKEDLYIVLDLIKHLFGIARELYRNNSVTDTNSYLKRFVSILKHNEISDNMYAEECAVIEEIFKQLSDESSENNVCRPSEIAKAMDFYITGRFDDDELDMTKPGIVYPLFCIDAACVKTNGNIHICMCDVEHLPGADKNYPWPLTHHAVNNIYEKTKDPLLLNMMQIMKSAVTCSRYFVYCALKNDDVTLSWVSTVSEKRLAASPYIKLIRETLEPEFIPSKRNSIYINDIQPYQNRIRPYSNDKAPSDIVKEARMDYALCPMKYVMGYVLEKYPSFQSDFQQKYILNSFISAVSQLMNESGADSGEVYKNIISLFPQMMRSEKRQVYDYISYDRKEYDYDYSGRSECGGKFYTDERLKMHYPNPAVREAVFEKYAQLCTPDGRKGVNLYERTDVQNACVFCQHVDYCRNAVYAVDQERYYD